MIEKGLLETDGKSKEEIVKEIQERFGEEIKIEFYAGDALKDETKLDLKQWDAEGFAVNEDGSIWINVDRLDNNTLDFNKLFVHEYAHSNGLNEVQAHYVEEAYADFLSEVSATGYIQVDGKIKKWESTNLSDNLIQQLVSYGPDGIQLKETTIKKSEYTKEELAKLEDDYRTVNMYKKSDLGYSYSLVVDGVLYENITLDSMREGANENEIIINVEGIEPEIYTGTLSRKDVEHIINRDYTFYDDLSGSYSSEKTKSSYLSFSDTNSLIYAEDGKENATTLKYTMKGVSYLVLGGMFVEAYEKVSLGTALVAGYYTYVTATDHDPIGNGGVWLTSQVLGEGLHSEFIGRLGTGYMLGQGGKLLDKGIDNLYLKYGDLSTTSLSTNLGTTNPNANRGSQNAIDVSGIGQQSSGGIENSLNRPANTINVNAVNYQSSSQLLVTNHNNLLSNGEIGWSQGSNIIKNEYVNLASAQRTQHILYGDKTGGGHMYPAQSGKSEFPASWSGNKIMNELSEIVTNPLNKWEPTRSFKGVQRYKIEAQSSGINIRVITDGKDIISGFPIGGGKK